MEWSSLPNRWINDDNICLLAVSLMKYFFLFARLNDLFRFF